MASGLGGRGGDASALEQGSDGFRRLRTDAQPVAGALSVDRELLGLIKFQGIEHAQFLDRLAVASGSLIHRSNAIKGTVRTAKALEANANHADISSAKTRAKK